MDSRRKNNRIPSQIRAECVVDTASVYHACLITDVGPDGVGILSSAQTTVRCGARALFRIYLPCGPIILRGRITWVRMLTKRRCLWAAGISITLIDLAQRGALLECAYAKTDSGVTTEARHSS
jgi:hypothetical protein